VKLYISALQLENGQTFTLIAENASKENIYIQSVTLNGKAYSKNYISHKDIVHGGEMVFQMGNTPNKNWGGTPADCPPALTKIP
jgi:putative alpha-1,2-mannosidase